MIYKNWHSSEITTIFAPSKNNNKKIKKMSAENLSDYLNPLVAVLCTFVVLLLCYTYKKTKQRSAINAIPGICTSLGILGTFVSIWLSIKVINSGNDGATLQNLLSSVAPAFVTSIIGSCFAVVSTFVSKIYFAKIDSKEENTHGTIEEVFYDIRSGINNLSSKIDEQNKSNSCFVKFIQSSLVDNTETLTRFIESFGQKLDTMVANTQEAVTSQMKILGAGQLEKMNEVISQIMTQLSSSAQILLTQHTETMKTMQSSQTDKFKELMDAQLVFVESINEENSTLKTNLASLVDKLQKEVSVSTQLQLQQQSTAMYAMLTSQKESFTGLMEQQKTFISGLKEENATLKESLSSLVGDLQSQVKTQCEALEKSIEQHVAILQTSIEFVDSRIGTVKANFDLATESFKDAMKLAIQRNENGEQAVEQMRQALETMQSTNQQMESLLLLIEANHDNHELLLQRMREMKSELIETQESLSNNRKSA